MIADTSFIIDLLRREEDALRKAEKLESDNKALSLTSITVYELWASISNSNSEEKEEILEIISSQPIHTLDKESAEKAGTIQEKLKQEGERIGHLDALIAGITAKQNEEVLTGNVNEFQRIKDLETKEY